MSNSRFDWWLNHVQSLPVFEAKVTDDGGHEVATFHVSADSFEEAEKLVLETVSHFRTSLSRYEGKVDFDKWMFDRIPDDFMPDEE